MLNSLVLLSMSISIMIIILGIQILDFLEVSLEECFVNDFFVNLCFHFLNIYILYYLKDYYLGIGLLFIEIRILILGSRTISNDLQNFYELINCYLRT